MRTETEEMPQRMPGHESLGMANKYLAIAQADLEAAHRDASPAMNWMLSLPGAAVLGRGSRRPALQRLVLASLGQAAIVEGVRRERRAERRGGGPPADWRRLMLRRLADVLPKPGEKMRAVNLVEALEMVSLEWAEWAAFFARMRKDGQEARR